MAAKGTGRPATPKRFKQARADARPAAKAAFSGKSKAGLKDPTLKLSADDKKAISEMQKEGAADKKAGLTRADTEARDATRRRAIEEFRRGESGPSSTSPKSTPVVKDKPSKPRLQGTSQAAASKPVKETKPKSKAAQVGRTGARATSGLESAATAAAREYKLDLAKRMAKSTPEGTVTDEMRRAGKNKALSYAARSSLDRDNSLGKNRNSKVEKSETKSKVKKPSSRGGGSVGKSVAIRPNAVISPKTGKDVAIRGKGTADVRNAKVTVIPRAAETRKPKFARTKAAGKGFLGTAVAAEGLSLLKGSSNKDLKELDRLKAKLAQAQGKTYKPGFFGNLKADAAGEVSQLASLASFGAIGKTRRQYMDELNTKIANTGAKNKSVKKPSVSTPTVGALRQGGMPGAGIAKAKDQGGMARPGVYKQGGMPGAGIAKVKDQGGMARPGVYKDAASSKTKGGTVAPGETYTVVSGDNLDAIAQRHGVSLKKILKENPIFTTNPKYKGGNMIWAGSRVRIPGK